MRPNHAGIRPAGARVGYLQSPLKWLDLFWRIGATILFLPFLLLSLRAMRRIHK